MKQEQINFDVILTCKAIISGTAVHIVPINDWIEHKMDAACVCQPETDFSKAIVLITHVAVCHR